MPVLLIAAGADRVVSTLAIEEFARRLKIGSHVIIPGSQHEILQERDELRQQFWAVFDGYVLGDKDDRRLDPARHHGFLYTQKAPVIHRGLRISNSWCAINRCA